MLRPPSGQGKLAHLLRQRQATEEAPLAVPFWAGQAPPLQGGSRDRRGDYQSLVSETNDKFEEFERKLRKAVEAFKQAQADKRNLQRELERLKANSKQGARSNVSLEREAQALRREREEVRSRIETLLEQIESLTKPDSGG